MNWRALDAIATLVFSAALVYFAHQQVKWGRQQWDAMIAQNTIMREQMVQTDKTLELMKAEQRAWLGVIRPKITPLAVGKPVTGEFTVKNSGQAPGTIQVGYTHVCQAATEKSLDATAAVFQNDLLKQPMRENAIPPEGAMAMHFESDGAVSQTVFDAINSGNVKLYVFGYFRYADATGEIRTTMCCFIYNTDTKELYGHSRYNIMD